jgi:hypothetical protein
MNSTIVVKNIVPPHGITFIILCHCASMKMGMCECKYVIVTYKNPFLITYREATASAFAFCLGQVPTGTLQPLIP